ncbi:MAG: hypothetical protein RR334_03945, partial [Clostridia bacterium]
GEEDSSNRDALVALGTNGTLLVKLKKTDIKRIVIKRVQPFKTFEISLVKSIIEELNIIQSLDISQEYRDSFQVYATEKAICKAVALNNSTTLQRLIYAVSVWGNRTYEGNKTSFGFIILPQKATKTINPNLHFSRILEEDFSALLSDGENTCLEISSDGYLIQHTTIRNSKEDSCFAPYDYINFASMCNGAKVGIALLSNGDLLLFKNKMLLFAKRAGCWVSFSHEEIIDRLGESKVNEFTDEVRKAIYLSALDTSFARTGGCIVHLNKEDSISALKHIDERDILIEEYYNQKVQDKTSTSFFFELNKDEKKPINTYEQFLKEDDSVKIATIRGIVKGCKFNELSRKLRKELISIDGATILDYDGSIVAVGAIIQIEAGSSGGGRLAAAKTLAKYGVSVKISADGKVQGFKMDRAKLRVKPIFAIG